MCHNLETSLKKTITNVFKLLKLSYGLKQDGGESFAVFSQKFEVYYFAHKLNILFVAIYVDHTFFLNNMQELFEMLLEKNALKFS